MSTPINIIPCTPADAPESLLYLADPSPTMVARYLSTSFVHIAQQNHETIGLCVLTPLSNTDAEIKNIAVREDRHGQGIGKQLLLHTIDFARARAFKTLHIGTGNSGFAQLRMYQRAGFEMTGIDLDFFTRNYPEPIVEDGIPCKHMVRLSMQL